MFGFFKKGKHDIKSRKVQLIKIKSFEEEERKQAIKEEKEEQIKFDAEFDNVDLRVYGLIDKDTLKLIFNGKELIVELLGFTRDNYLVLKNISDNELTSTDSIKIFYEGDVQYIMIPLKENRGNLAILNIRVNRTVFQFSYRLDLTSVQQIDLVSVIKAITNDITLIA